MIDLKFINKLTVCITVLNVWSKKKNNNNEGGGQSLIENKFLAPFYNSI